MDKIQAKLSQKETPPSVPRPEICLQYSWQLPSHEIMEAPSTFKHTGMQSLAHSGTSACATTVTINVWIRSRTLVLFIMAIVLPSILPIDDQFFSQFRTAGCFVSVWRQKGWSYRHMLGKKSVIPQFFVAGS